jgi:hypothetical protein
MNNFLWPSASVPRLWVVDSFRETPFRKRPIHNPYRAPAGKTLASILLRTEKGNVMAGLDDKQKGIEFERISVIENKQDVY